MGRERVGQAELGAQWRAQSGAGPVLRLTCQRGACGEIFYSTRRRRAAWTQIPHHLLQETR